MAIIELVLRYKTDRLIESLSDEVFFVHPRFGHPFLSINNPILPQMLGIPAARFRQRLTSDSTLMRSGVLQIDSDGELLLLDQIMRLAYQPFDPNEDVPELLFDVAPKAELEWQDYDHVARARDHVESLFRGALDTRATGVNVLLYGPHGTGKTEFCKLLAERLGVPVYSIGECGEDGHMPSGKERLGELLRGWGVGVNGRLEEVRGAVLWTTNCTHGVSPAVLRRMMFAFELRQPSPGVRARIWSRQLEKHGIRASDEDARALARHYDVTPGIAVGATKAAHLIKKGDIGTVRFGVQSLSKLVYGEKPPKEAAARIDPALVSADADASKLAERLAKRGPGRMSICLHGPPGTGKSAFVRYLGERMDIEVVQKRASDLLSMWVGGSEANIAQAFEEARDNSHFLVFDEADSLLSDRRHAQRNWEVSQVNEMLTWMEHHPLPFACTTNYMDRLDSATLRRFDFKMALGYLSAEQAMIAFRSFFQLEPPRSMSALHELTPGDFALVRRKAEVLGALQDREALVDMLREECEAKPGSRRQIGFAA